MLIIPAFGLRVGPFPGFRTHGAVFSNSTGFFTLKSCELLPRGYPASQALQVPHASSYQQDRVVQQPILFNGARTLQHGFTSLKGLQLIDGS